MSITILNSLTSVLAGFAIFSILGYIAHNQNAEVEDVVTDGMFYRGRRGMGWEREGSREREETRESGKRWREWGDVELGRGDTGLPSVHESLFGFARHVEFFAGHLIESALCSESGKIRVHLASLAHNQYKNTKVYFLLTLY